LQPFDGRAEQRDFGSLNGPSVLQLARQTDLVEKGALRTTMNRTFGTITSASLTRAHALLESGKSRGKIVLEGW
jgi:NADPH:quinone reductase-like Zn-dependent oxidoreductase